MTQESSTTEVVDHSTDSTNVVPPELQALIDAIKSNPERTAEEIKKLRLEAKTNREKANDAEAKRKADELKALEDSNQWKDAAEAYKKQLEALAPVAEQLQAMKQSLSDSAQKRIQALPERWRSAVPEYDDPAKTLQWLDVNAALFTQSAAPQNTGAGERGDVGGKKPQPTAEEIEYAAKMHIPIDEYMRNKNPRTTS